jgi:hypothetical protein
MRNTMMNRDRITTGFPAVDAAEELQIESKAFGVDRVGGHSLRVSQQRLRYGVLWCAG